jgi:hypothetical protein
MTMRVSTDQMGRVPLQCLGTGPNGSSPSSPRRPNCSTTSVFGERVVGITKFCVHPETWFKTKHRVGGTKKVDLDKVRALKPDLIIGNKEENERKDIQALEQEFPVWMSDVRDLPGALGHDHRVG